MKMKMKIEIKIENKNNIETKIAIEIEMRSYIWEEKHEIIYSRMDLHLLSLKENIIKSMEFSTNSNIIKIFLIDINKN